MTTINTHEIAREDYVLFCELGLRAYDALQRENNMARGTRKLVISLRVQ